VQPTATGGLCGIPTLGTVRVVMESKDGLPTDPDDPRAFSSVFTDLSPLFVIHGEIGWYEGWMIHDIVVPEIAAPLADGRAHFGTITAEDAAALKRKGGGHNMPGSLLTMDGNPPHLPGPGDRFPGVQTNVVPLQVSAGTYNAMQQGDIHGYWEFNHLGTNRVHPLYELPFTGGFPDHADQAPDAFQKGNIVRLRSIVPGSGLMGVKNKAEAVGDNPNLPRDPDRLEAVSDAPEASSQRETRYRGIPSGLAHEILLNVFARPASFAPREVLLLHTEGGPPPSHRWRRTSSVVSSRRMRRRWLESIRTGMGSSPPRKGTSMPHPMTSPTTRGCTCRRPPSIGSR